MDSKLRRTAILSSMAVILLVSFLVWNANNKNGNSAQGGQQPSQATEPPADGAANGQNNGQSGSQNSNQIGNDLSAFLRDPTFFDPETDPVLDALKNNINRLSLVATSVEKDLRIQIVNGDGTPVAGESFVVELEGAGQFEDLDRDGVIYIGGLEAGDYSVKLLPAEGYRTPDGGMKVRVKGKVEYLAIEDISLLIKAEEDIEAGIEDVTVKDALTDADGTEIQRLQKVAGAKTGIDVSGHSGVIDWKRVSDAGVEFAIIRAGYRGSVTGCLVEDPYFQENMRGAAANGISVGVYFSTQAVNEVEAVEEASAALELIREYSLDYPVFIDAEGVGIDGRADGLDADARALVCEAFCRTVENEGYDAGVYGSRYWYTSRMRMDGLQDYYIWLAEYRSIPRYDGYYHMWQYTSKGTVDGIPGNVNMSVSYMGR